MDDVDEERIDAATDIVADILVGGTDLGDEECERLARKIVKRVVKELTSDGSASDDDDGDDDEDESDEE